MKKATFFDLVAAMKSRQPIAVGEPHNFTVLVNAIAAEDGSGRNWNVGVINASDHTHHTVFWSEDGSAKFFLQ